jgi:hypothetical protein
MPHRQLTDLTNRGDAWRLTYGAGAFIRALAPDVRIQALYSLWCESREKATWASVVAARMVGSHRLRDEQRRYVDRELAATERFLRDEVQLKAAWGPWVALSLTNVFELWRTWKPHSPEPEFSIPVTWLPPNMPAGKKPPRDGQEIARNVRWVCLVDVSHEKTVNALIRDYEATSGCVDGRKYVHDCLDQGRRLLDLVAKTTVRLID